VLRDNLDQGFDLLRLALTQPRFDEMRLERVRAQAVSSLRRETTNPNSISNRVWWKTAFPHPSLRPSDQRHAGVGAHHHPRGPARLSFARAEPRYAEGRRGRRHRRQDARPALDRVFGALPAKGQLQSLPAARIQDVGRRIVIDLDVPQAVLSFGGVGLARKDPDFMPAFVVNHILGGGSFSSRLYTEVREKRGLPMACRRICCRSTAPRCSPADADQQRKRREALKIIEAESTDGHRRPDREGAGRGEGLPQGLVPAPLRHLLQDRQLRAAGAARRARLDYIDKRNNLIDAVTIEDARRVAKASGRRRHAGDGGGPAQGLTSNEPGK
jgi:zinc protease